MKTVVLVMVLATAAQAAPRTFAISASTTKWKKGAKVKVTMTYTNLKDYPVRISTYDCKWTMHFARVDPELDWDERACGRTDRAATYDLKPNESKTWTIDMHPVKDAKAGPHTLQLTFAPDGAPARFWSNEVPITVEP